jgi:Peptidase family M28
VSDDIVSSASWLAAQADRAGLQGIEFLRLSPDDGPWDLFECPPRWTPRGAHIVRAVDDVPIVEYPSCAYSLAMNSAPQPELTVRVVEFGAPDAAGALVLLADDADLNSTVDRLVRDGAAGFAARVAVQPSARGRIELVEHAGQLFGFSVTADELAELRTIARGGGAVRVRVDVSATGALPLVTGLLPGSSADEVLIVAHLCHPAPGANDNAAGVLAGLEVVRALADRMSTRRPSLGIRWLWTAEMVGSAAYLSMARRDDTSWRPPLCVICLDMVGQDPSESCLIVEEGPTENDSVLLAVLAESIEQGARSLGTSYSGSVPLPRRPWALTPFAGASDHVLYADESCGSSVVQLSHWPDARRHTSADTPEHVSTDEVANVVAAVCAALTYCYATPADGQAELMSILRRHHLRRLLNHCAVTAERESAAHPRAWRITDREHVPGYAAIRDAFASWRSSTHVDPPRSGPPAAGSRRHSVIPQRQWQGAFNVRALLLSAPGGEVRDLLGRGGSGWYSKTVALAMSIDGRRDTEEIVAHASAIVGLAIDRDWARDVLGEMLRTGFIKEAVASRPEI